MLIVHSIKLALAVAFAMVLVSAPAMKAGVQRTIFPITNLRSAPRVHVQQDEHGLIYQLLPRQRMLLLSAPTKVSVTDRVVIAIASKALLVKPASG